MADGVTFQSAVPATPPDLTIVATDDAGAAGHVQLFKLAYSANGVATLVPADVDGLLVNLGANNDVTVTGSVTATGPLTDTQLRATAVPISGTVAVTGVATAANQTTELTDLGGVTETAPASDTASSGLNGRLQRIAQRITSLIALLPAALGAGGGLKVDGSGTALPVSGTVTATVGTVTAVTSITNVVHVDDNAGSLTVDAASLPLPTGASTEATLAAQSAKLPATLGQKAKTASLAVVLASDSDALAISGSVTASGTVALSAGSANIGDVDVLTLPALPAGTNAIGKLAANSGVDIGDVDVTSLPAITGTVTANAGTPVTATTATLTNTNDSASSVTVQASNASRKGLILYNDSTQVAYVKFGATATSTAFSVYMAPGATYEMGPNVYSGIVDAIWAADASGAMRATEW